MSSLDAETPLQFLRGVGPRKAAALETLNLRTVADLLEYFPFRYELQLGDVEIADLRPGVVATVRGEVTHLKRRHPHLTAEICDGSGECVLRWFNQPYSGQGLRIGATVIATGKVQMFNDGLELVQPNVQVFETDAALRAAQPGMRRFGVYSGNAEVKSNTIRRLIETALAHPEIPVREFLPPPLLKKHGFPRRDVAVRQMHMPDDEKTQELARKRLAYEEFLLLEAALALRRRKLLSLQEGIRLKMSPEIDRRIRARYPFSLTAAQDKTIREIVRDLTSGRPMTRLLQGDVGSGKTVVALYACLVAVADKRQAAIMAPTEILAAQHFANIEKYLANSRVRRVLLRGGMPQRERQAALRAIEAGELDLVVGTQALLQSDVAFRDLALVVVDEQHKFGVMQRAGIRTKGPLPHYLVMTATPIPRTLAMTVFGDLDVSIIAASPPGRGKIATRVVAAKQWATVMSYVRKRLEAGEQAYVVCPLIGVEHPPSVAASSHPRVEHPPSVALQQKRVEHPPSAALQQNRVEHPPPVASSSRETRSNTGPISNTGIYRRNMPHIQKEGATYFVTFCTKDREVLPESAREAVLRHCLHDHGTKADLLVAIVMPDHVHLLFSPLGRPDGSSYLLQEILQPLKGASAHTVNQLLGRKGAVWQAESFDRLVRSTESLQDKIDYVLNNPVRKGIVRRFEDYRWLWHAGMPDPRCRASAPGCWGTGDAKKQPGADALHQQPRADALHQKEILSARRTFDRLQNGPWKGLKLGLLHGGMKTAEKDEVIGAFARGELHAVISTTVVEVGVDVPTASIMIVEHNFTSCAVASVAARTTVSAC